MNGTTEVFMFGDTYDVDMSVMQMESIAADLVFLLKHSGLSRSELASSLGWTKSRVTKVLSGDENLTIKTITSITECLGYGFDVVFYNENYEQPKQPWHIDKLNKSVCVEPIRSESFAEIKIQSSEDVFEDLMKGNDADKYVSIKKINKDISTKWIFDIDKIESLQRIQSLPDRNNTFYWDIPARSEDSFASTLEEKG